MFPWWVGVALAATFYFVLHHLASRPAEPTAVGTATSLATSVIPMLWKMFAEIGQYLLPVLCLVGAAISVVKSRSASKLATSAASGNYASAVDGMSWKEFEQLVSEAFRRQGFRVNHTGDNGPDGGVDIILHKDGERHFVQCKQWKAYNVGVTIVRELYGVMAAKGAASGYVVTSGRFTDEAVRFAEGRNLHLLDGNALRELLEEGRTTSALPTSVPTSAPACPTCGATMIRRNARRGGQAGNYFWGCPSYPSCRGTRPGS